MKVICGNGDIGMVINTAEWERLQSEGYSDDDLDIDDDLIVEDMPEYEDIRRILGR